MKKITENVILYLKVFAILFVLGFLLPYTINLIHNLVFLKQHMEPPDNYLFVLSHLKRSKPFYEVVFDILVKIIEF